MKTNSRFTRVAVASGLVVACGAAVLGITGFASAELAHENDPAAVAQGMNATVSGSFTLDSIPQDAVTGQSVDGATVPSDPQDADHGAPKFATEGLAGVLKLTIAEMNTQLQSGKTLADIAKAQNVDIADVKAQLLKDFTEKEQAEVASGEHTQAEVDAKITEFKTRLDDMVNGVRPAGGPGMGGKGMRGSVSGPTFLMDGVDKILGLSSSEIQEQVQSGKTLADIAKAQKVDIADVKAQILKNFTDHENAEVAAGEHTQAEVDAKIAEFKTRLDDIVNGVRPAGGPGMGGRGGHGHGHGGRGHHGDMGGMPGDQGTGTAEGAGFSA